MSDELVVGTSTSEEVAQIVNDQRVNKKTATSFTVGEVIIAEDSENVIGSGVDIDGILKLDQTTPQTITNDTPIFNSLTSSELVATDASKQLQSLEVATYPSLTELSYVKGLTSPIQTQITGFVEKDGVSGGQTINGSTLTNEDLNLRSNAVDLTTGSVNFLDTLEASSSTVGAVTVAGGLAVAKRLYALDMTVTNDITGSITGNAGTVTNGVYTNVANAFTSTGTNSFAGNVKSTKNIIAGFTSITTAAGTTTLTVASTKTQEFTGTTTQTVVLPVVSTLTTGHSFKIINNSTGSITVQSSGLNEVVVLLPNENADIECILITGATASSWDVSRYYTATPDYTGEKTNKIGIFDAGDGEEGAEVIYSGPLKQDGTYGLTLVNGVTSVEDGSKSLTVGDIIYLQTDGTYTTGTSSIQRFSSKGGEKWFMYANFKQAIIGRGFTNTGASSIDFSVVNGTETYGIIDMVSDNNSNFIATRCTITGVLVDDYSVVINMTALDIEHYTEAEMLAQVQGGYIDGMQNTGDKKISSLDSLSNVVSYNYRNAGGSLPNGVTNTEIHGVKTQNVSDKTAIATAIDIDTTNFPLAKANGSYVLLQDDGTLMTGVVDGTDTTTDAGDIQYELDTPIISYTNNQNLIAETDGSFIWENKFEVVEIYGTGIDITKDGKYSDVALSQAIRYDPETGLKTIIDITDFTVTTGIATNADLLDTDLIYFEVEWSDYAIIPETQFIYSQNLTGTVAQLNNSVASLNKLTLEQANKIDSLERKLIQSGVYAYLMPPESTTVTTAETYYPVEGTFINPILRNFELTTVGGNAAIKYIGDIDRVFELNISASLSGDANGITARIGVNLNSTLCTESGMSTYLKTSGESQYIGCLGVTTLSKDDTVQLMCTADGNGDVLTFDKFNTSIKQFFN